MSRLRDLVSHEPKRGLWLPAWVERLTAIGIVSTDPQVVRRQRFTNVAAFAGAGNALSHFVINIAYNVSDLTIIHVYNAAFAIAALLLHRLHRLGPNVAAIALVSLIVIGNSFVTLMLGLQSSLHVYFTLAGAMVFMYGVENWKLFVGWFVVVCVVLVVLMENAPADGLLMVHDAQLRKVLSSHAMINTITINAVMIFYALLALRRAEVELEHQYARSEALIETVMPPSIAARLKDGTEQRIADRIENLSVLFADLVGFSTAAHDLTPDVVVEYLDALVREFDALCLAHGAEKIKTVGDSYMAVGGLTGDARAGALATGRFALAMQAAIASRPPLGTSRMMLRIGIHCGPATAGVIGDTRFSYDVWGDAVNMASRMESHGVPGRIQVTAEFHDLARDAFVFEERGATEIKGLGVARTYFLLKEA